MERDRNGRCERARFDDARKEKNLDQPQYLSSVISRRRGSALRERLRGARDARLTRVDEERQGGGWHVEENENIAKPARERERSSIPLPLSLSHPPSLSLFR